MGERDEAAIRTRAYELWAQSGYIDGQHDYHWRQAERELGGSDPEKPAEKPKGPERRVDGVSSLPAIGGTDGTPPRGSPGRR